MRGDPYHVIRQARKLTDSVLVGLSGGKDSLAVLELCHIYKFKIKAYFQYFIPDISFQDQFIDYCQRRYDIEIIKFPHWGLSHQLREWAFCNPIVTEVPRLKLKDVENWAREKAGILWVSTGQRKDDSLERRAMLVTCGGISIKHRRFYPIMEWGAHHVFNFLKARNVPLPADYRIFRSSWGGRIWAEDLLKIKEHYPEDYQKIIDFFPYVEAQIKRLELQEARKSEPLSVVEGEEGE